MGGTYFCNGQNVISLDLEGWRLHQNLLPPSVSLTQPVLPPLQMPLSAERWWDQRVHFPPPPPSLPPSTPLLVAATTSDESAMTNNKDDTPEYTADEQSARLCAVLEALYIEHPIGMRNIQALSLVSRGLQVGVRSLLSTATVARLHGPTDFSFATAAFVARRLPAVRRIVTEGSDVGFARIRERAAAGEDVCVADFGEAALLVGTLLAATLSDGTLVMSDGRKLSLRALRESRRVRLRGVRTRHEEGGAHRRGHVLQRNGRRE